MKTFSTLPCVSALCCLAIVLRTAGAPVQLNFGVSSRFNESNRQAVLEWNAEAAKTYLVQSATNLSPSTEWKIEEPVRATNGGTIQWTAPEPLRTQKYYRLVLPTPEVFSVEPAFVNSDDPGALFYLIGQCLPTNGSVMINGQNFAVSSFDPNGSWVAVSLNGLPPGVAITRRIVVLDNFGNTVATLPLHNPVFYGAELSPEQLQGPPDEPPARPDTHIVEEIEFVVEKVERARMVNPGHGGGLHNKDYATDPYVETSQRAYLSKKGYDYYQSLAAASVSPASGELQYQSTDLAIRGRGLSFEWTRTYRSRTGPTTAQGVGWDFSYNVSLSQLSDGTVLLRPGNGRADTFYPDGTNGWTRDEYFVEIRDLNDDGMPDVLFADTGKWLFKPAGPEAGKLWKIIDRNNNAITLDYDGAGRLASIVDTLDRTNTVAYTPAGQIASVTDFSGRTVRYEYDGHGDLVACISPRVVGTPTRNDFPGGKTNRFTYTSGNLDDRLNHDLVSITDPKGQTALQVIYHNTNNPESLDFDTVRTVLRGVEKKDIRRGMVIARPSNSFATVQTIVNDYVGNVSEHLFDSRQRCVSLREFTGRANPSLPTTATENRPAGKLRAEDPDFFETRWEWNSDSLCTREIRADGSSTEISHQRAQDHNSSRSNKTASRRHDGNVRVLRERASNPVDADGDGVAETTALASYFEYDPRFGSPANGKGKKLYVGNLPFSSTDATERGGWDGTIKGSSGVESARVITDRETGRSKGFGFVTSTIDARGILTTSEYDSNGNCTRSIKNGHYAVSNFRIEVDAVYNSHGQLTAITNAPDANGHRRVDTISYYSSGSQRGMVEVLIAAGMAGGLALATAFEYDPRGNVTNIVDPRGNGTIFTYNSLDQCIQSQSASYGGGNGLPPQRITTQYLFDANNNLIRCDVENRDETAALDRVNPHWSAWFEYDGPDRLTSVVREIAEGGGLPGRYATNRFVYNGNDNLVEARSPLAVSGADPQNIVAFEHDERGLLFREVAAPGSLEQSSTQYDYDRHGNLARMSEALEFGPSVTTFEYQPLKYVGGGGKAQGVMGQKAKAWMVNNYEVHPVFGLKTEWITSLSGAGELLEWVETVWNKQCVEKDTTVRLAAMTDAMGNVVTFHYDRNGNLKAVRHFGETNDVPRGAGNTLLAETRFSYDSFDRCVQKVDSHFDTITGLDLGDGQAATTFTYAPNGSRTSVTDDNGHTTRFTYDTADRLASVTGPKSNVLEFAFDGCGNLTSVVSSERSDLNQAPQQSSTIHTYDPLNRLITTADNVGNTHRYAYDSRDNVVSYLDPRENETFAVFDGLSRCVAATNYAGKERGITISTTHVEYDVNSRRIAATDSNGNTTQYAYDSLGRCVSVTEADGTSSSLVWSPRSNLLRQQDANGTVISNRYDLLNRCVSSIITPGPTVSPTTTFETFAYDGFSRCVAASNDVSLVTFDYDSLEGCVRSTQDGFTSSATYDGAGNCLSRTYPGGRVVTYTYDALDQIVSVSSGGAGRPPTSLAQYAYEGAGRVGRVNRANNVGTRVQWNGLVDPPNAIGDSGWQRVSRVTHAVGAAGLLLDQRTLQRDSSQNTISRVRTARAIVPAETITLNYDAMDRLTNFVRVSGSPADVARQYMLDGNGNRQTVLENSVPQAYFMDNTLPVPADFQMNQYTSTPFDTRQHDENGNLVVRTTAVGPSNYHYDYADRLVRVEGLNGEGIMTTIATYAYDALGRRIRKTMNAHPPPVLTAFLLSAEGAVLEERVNGTLTRAYVYPEIDDEVLVAFNQAGEPHYYHYDDLGNTLALTDMRGTVVERYDYDDYGEVTFLTGDGIPTGAASSAVDNVYCWGGLRFDSETGLHTDNNGSYYDSLTARHIGLPKITPKISKEHHGKFRLANNPWSGGSAQAMKTGKVKFFNEAKGFGRSSSGAQTRAQDHNSSRSNKTASTKAQDHNSSRSNKTASTKAQDHNSSRSNRTASTKAQDHNSSRSNKTASTKAQDHNSSRSNKTASTKAQDHNSSRSNKTASTKAQDHNSSRSNKTASNIAPGGGSGVTITVKLIVPVAMDK